MEHHHNTISYSNILLNPHSILLLILLHYPSGLAYQCRQLVAQKSLVCMVNNR